MTYSFTIPCVMDGKLCNAVPAVRTTQRAKFASKAWQRSRKFKGVIRRAFLDAYSHLKETQAWIVKQIEDNNMETKTFGMWLNANISACNKMLNKITPEEFEKVEKYFADMPKTGLTKAKGGVI